MSRASTTITTDCQSHSAWLLSRAAGPAVVPVSRKVPGRAVKGGVWVVGSCKPNTGLFSSALAASCMGICVHVKLKLCCRDDLYGSPWDRQPATLTFPSETSCRRSYVPKGWSPAVDLELRHGQPDRLTGRASPLSRCLQWDVGLTSKPLPILCRKGEGSEIVSALVVNTMDRGGFCLRASRQCVVETS